MIALLAIEAADTGAIVGPIGVGAVLIAMLKMTWTGYQNSNKVEAAMRKSFADDRAARELEYTASDAKQKQDYSDSLIRHKTIHAHEIAAFQERITGYIEEQVSMKGRISRLEDEVKELRTR